MSLPILFLGILIVSFAAFYSAQRRSIVVAGVGGVQALNSLPFYYGVLAACWSLLPSLGLILAWNIFDEIIIEQLIFAQVPQEALDAAGGNVGLVFNQISNMAHGSVPFEGQDPAVVAVAHNLISYLEINRWAMTLATFAAAIVGAALVFAKVSPRLQARMRVEHIFQASLLVCSSIAILTTVGIVVSVLYESIRFFQQVSPAEFLFGLEWSPQTAIREDQQGSSGSFGAIPLFAGTFLIAGIALLLAVPTGLMVAIYLTEYAGKRARDLIKPVLEVLAGVPTVVYGFFAALTVAPLIRDLGVDVLHLDQWLTVTAESALAAGLVMGIMIIPFVSSLSDDVINAVPRGLRDGALGLGATQSEVIRNVIIPAALPGIVGSVLLAASRAIGETMIVVMAAGLAANLTANPFDSVTTVTVQIVTLLVGDQEFDSPKTLAAFALGLVLFLVTLGLNYLALHIVRKYREQYE